MSVLNTVPVPTHGPITMVAPGLWEVRATLTFPPMPRSMAIHRLPDGTLWLHSVITLDAPQREALEALGPIGIIVVPSPMHRMDARAYRERYPEATVLCPEAARPAVERVVPVDGTCEAVLPGCGVICHQADGLKPTELVYELALGGGAALIFCDAVFHLPNQPGCAGQWMRWIGSTGFFGTTWIGRRLLDDRVRWRQWLEQQSERQDLSALHMAHGEPITVDCAQHLRAAAARLA